MLARDEQFAIVETHDRISNRKKPTNAVAVYSQLTSASTRIAPTDVAYVRGMRLQLLLVVFKDGHAPKSVASRITRILQHSRRETALVRPW